MLIRRSFNLPEDLAGRLNRLAAESDTPPDLIVVAALEEFLDQPVEIDGVTYKDRSDA